MQLKKQTPRIKHGDTIIEVALAFATFGAVAMFAVNMMNSGLNSIQRTLETTMARNAIDSQADSLRYIHNNYLSERNFADERSQYMRIWKELKASARNPREISVGDNVASFDVNEYKSCEGVYNGESGHPSQVRQYKGFVVNPRYLIPDYGDAVNYGGRNYASILKNSIVGGSDATEMSSLTTSPLYPRIIYSAVASTKDSDSNLKEAGVFQQAKYVQGIWDIVIYSNANNRDRSEYFDFYIRTCWDAAGMRTPSNITTIVRLYNPEVIEE